MSLPARERDGAPVDPRAELRALFDTHAGYVDASLRRLGVPDRDRDDLVQEVFLAVYRALGDYDGSRPPKPWLFAFCFRISSNYRRLARHRVEAFVEREASAPRTPEDAARDSETRSMLERALAHLADEYRAAFVLHVIDGASGPEVAEALGLPLQTTYGRIRVAKRSVRSALEAMMDEEAP